ncbi:MAG: leucyl aminopeptidase family protein [Alphaproteobacteria bacterium]|nr:leucyl aminopeptidase family protein [Alphaproteobacteria bacterium]
MSVDGIFPAQPGDIYVTDKGKPACLIRALTPAMLESWRAELAGPHLLWMETAHFSAARGEVLLLPDSAGGLEAVLLGLGANPDPMALAALPKKLPEGAYRLDSNAPQAVRDMAPLAWAMGTYTFDIYKKPKSASEPPKLVLDSAANRPRIERLNRAVFSARHLINTPAADMGPKALQAVMEKLAATHKAQLTAICGDDLLTENYPMIHAVGRAAVQSPRFLDLLWGDEAAPKLTLIGKGVCFDTGGLNLKPGNYMDLMKKDMGGAALAIALADAVMDAKLPVRLRLMIGAVENAIGPDAFRPGDVLESRKGLSVEIGNTDAEGRLVLADMLAEADDEAPDMMVDFATLTGAARVAMGPELTPFYTHSDRLADGLAEAANAAHDPLWRMPLWPGYDGWLDSPIADVSHISSSPMGGSITAALFLARFVEQCQDWVHFDTYAWNLKPRAGRPVGGEAQAVRAVYDYLEKRFGGQ